MTCSEAAKQPTRDMLLELTPRAVKAASDYADAGHRGTVEELSPADFRVTDEVDPHLRANYSDRMLKRARALYDGLFLVSDICGLCGAQRATTLDHYLPKNNFPLLSVAPENLLPACPDCNKWKSDYRPDGSRAALLHPYFDEFLDEPWLHATVSEPDKAVVFGVSPPDDWSAERTRRVLAHFHHLRLDGMFGVWAAQEIAGVRFKLERLPSDVRREVLSDEAGVWSRAHGPNHWRPVMYRALVTSEWYVSEGYAQMC